MIDVPDAPPLPPADLAGPEAWYRERRDRFRAEAAVLGLRAARLANVRLTLFVAALAVALWALIAETPALLGVAAALGVGFAALVRRYQGVERQRRHLAGLAELAEEALLRIARDWHALPLRHGERAEADHPYASDLDLLGRGSLLQLAESVGTRLGLETLRGWLLTPAAPPTVRERQVAVAELDPLATWREELVWRGRAAGSPSPDPEPFLTWAEGEPFLARRQALLWGARISPPIFWVLLLGHGAGLIAWPFWLLPLVANLLVGWRLVGTAVRYLQQVRYVADALGAYADAFEHLAGAEPRAPALQRLQAVLTANGRSAASELRSLHGIIRLAQPAASMVYPLIELTTLWNVHVLSHLEGWQARHGRHARGWLGALGEAEALAALARLRHDNPSWAFPTLDPAARAYTATGLGHPLLPATSRIANDVELGPPGTFLLVTGSNMSGKSTLLRAVGLNAILAQAGGPVCATSLTMPPLAVWTSMRISDSLERGVSFFMAELERLRQVVDAARVADRQLGDGVTSAEPVPAVLYLLDEILQGTNTAERQIAARRVIRLLLACPSIGAVSTHDLTLADAPDLAATAEAIHLTETVADGPDGAEMRFDYTIRPGIARSTNALRLLDLVGLTEPEGAPGG